MKYSTRIIQRMSLILAALLSTMTLVGLSNRFEDLTPTAHAAVTRTWNGGNGNWSTPSNWSPNGVPGENDSVTINSGTVDVTTDVTVSVLNLSGGAIRGNGTLTITGTMDWTDGTMGEESNGTTVIAQGATANISTASIKILGTRTLNNNGTIKVTGVGATFGFCGHNFTLNNAGTMDFGANSNFTICNGSVGTINNTGTLKKSSEADVSSSTHTLNNDGAVEVLSGELRLGNFDSNTSSSGMFNVAAGATLNFSSGTNNLTNRSSIRGAGNVVFSFQTANVNGTFEVTGTTTVSAGTTNFNTNAFIPTLNLSGGRLAGSGTVTVTGTMDWTGGTMGEESNGTTVIAQGATANISTASIKILGTRTLNNNGTIKVTGVGATFGFCGHNFTLNNAGTMDFGANSNFTICNGSVGTINNTGTLRKSAGTDVSTITQVLNNGGTVSAQAGTLNLPNGYIQTAGATVLGGGNLSLDAGPLSLNGGALIGTGIIDGNVVNASTVSPGLAAPNAFGRLTITRDYTQTAAGKLLIEIGGTTPVSQFDQLALGVESLSKVATLGGTLDARTVNGFTPAPSDSFEVTQYSQRAGTFPNFDGADIGHGRTLTPDYRPNNLVLIASGLKGDITGCGSPARIWAQIIAPRTARLHNFAGGTLYKSTILYGNSGGTGTVALITATFKNLKSQHVITTEGVEIESFDRVTDPVIRQKLESLPIVLTDSATGDRSVPVIVFIPPDNPACRNADSGGGNINQAESPGSFTVKISVAAGTQPTGPPTSVPGAGTPAGPSVGSDPGSGTSSTPSGPPGSSPTTGPSPGPGSGTGSAPGSGTTPGSGSGSSSAPGAGSTTTPSTGCDPDFISESDIRATQVDTARIRECIPSMEPFLRALPVGGNEALDTIEDASEASDSPRAMFNFLGELAWDHWRPKVPGQDELETIIELADKALDVYDGCGRFLPNETRFVFSCDPNEKVGASGAGGRRFISGDAHMPYAIFFENKRDASAPAQDVVITDQLDTSKLDLSTFQLGPIRFADKTVLVPSNRKQFTGEVDLRPEKNLLVRIHANLDIETGLVTWRFTSVDPQTLLHTDDPLAGFLPPNRIPAEGEGSVLFTIKAKPGLPSGTEIQNAARIVFDTNSPIDTPVWLNTVDDAKPTSRVNALVVSQCASSFTVRWSGGDAESGIANYSIFVSENDGPFQLWRNTAETSALFTGQPGKTYAFYSLARDRVGNTEVEKTSAEATIRVNESAGASEPANQLDADGDGISDLCDQNLKDGPKGDLDGDGVQNATETSAGSNPNDPNSKPEECDGKDNDLDGEVDEGFPDTDGRGLKDCADPDDDEDGQMDAHEIACGSDPLMASSKSPDLEGDNVPDCVDPDDDGDNRPDTTDNCPRKRNLDQADADGDGIGDACDDSPGRAKSASLLGRFIRWLLSPFR